MKSDDIGSRKETLHRLPKGHPASTPKEHTAPVPEKRPDIYPRTVTLYLPPGGDPSSAPGQRACLASPDGHLAEAVVS